MTIDNLAVHKGIKSIFDEIISTNIKKKTKQEPYIRPSMAPCCALKMFITIAEGIGNNSEWDTEENFMFSYYTSVGTLTHLLFQKWFGRTGKLLGNWSCLCQGTKKVKAKKGRTVVKEDRPAVYLKEITAQKICPHCKKEMLYEEVEIKLEGISGHVDGILELTVNKKKYHIIIDYKGTNVDKISRDNPKYPQYPDPKHVKQLSIYTYALSQLEELNVIGWALLYTSRDTPIPKYKIIPHVMSPTDWKEAKELTESQEKQVRILYKSLDDGNIKRILEHKLCKNHSYYTKKVESKYSTCEYAGICFSAPKQLTSILKEAKKNLV